MVVESGQTGIATSLSNKERSFSLLVGLQIRQRTSAAFVCAFYRPKVLPARLIVVDGRFGVASAIKIGHLVDQKHEPRQTCFHN